LISKLWIAEGLVEERGDGTTMEEVARVLPHGAHSTLSSSGHRKECMWKG